MLPTSCSEGKIPRADKDVLVLHVGGECNNSGGKRRHKKIKQVPLLNETLSCSCIAFWSVSVGTETSLLFCMFFLFVHWCKMQLNHFEGLTRKIWSLVQMYNSCIIKTVKICNEIWFSERISDISGELWSIPYVWSGRRQCACLNFRVAALHTWADHNIYATQIWKV